MSVPTSGAGAHQPALSSSRSFAEKRTASGVEKVQIRPHPNATSSSSSTHTPALSYQSTASGEDRLDSPMPPLIHRSLVQRGRGVVIAGGDRGRRQESERPIPTSGVKQEPPSAPARPQTPPSLIPDHQVDSVDGLLNLGLSLERKSSHRPPPDAVLGGPRLQGTFMEELAKAMPYLMLPRHGSLSVAESKTTVAMTPPPATTHSSSSSSTTRTTPPASLDDRLAAARDTASLAGLEGDALMRESKIRRAVFSHWAASLAPETLVQAFRQAGACLSHAAAPSSPNPAELRLALWEMMSLASQMTPAQQQAELQVHQDITVLSQARHPGQPAVLLRSRFIALYAAMDTASRQAALEAARDLTPLLGMNAKERGLTLQIRTEQFKAHSFLCAREDCVAELAHLRQPGVMNLMENQLLTCEAELRTAQFKGDLYYLSASERWQEVNKALDMSTLRKIHAQSWDRTLLLRECEFAAYTSAIGEEEGAEALKNALLPENLGTMREASQERTLELRLKLVQALMRHCSNDSEMLNRALAILKDPIPLSTMSSQRLGHALRLRKEAFALWLEAQPDDQRGEIVRRELAEAFDTSRLTRLTLPLQASVGMLRLALAEVAVRYL